MRKILYTFIIIFNTALLYTQWSWVNPIPQGNKLNQIVRLNNGNIISAGEFGTIILSTNGGGSWNVTHRIHDTTSSINSIFRLTDNLIFAGSHESRILRSTNAGLNWTVISRIGFMLYNLKRVFFLNSSLGYVLFANQVFKTTNGGFDWVLAGNLSQQCNDIFFTDNNTGFAAGGAIVDNSVTSWVFKTTNGGANWLTLPVPEVGPVTRIQFLNSSIGYMSGFSVLLKTTNSGSNWTALSNLSGNQFKDFYFFDENTGYAGTYSYFLKTSNGGLNWSSILLPYYTFNAYTGMKSISFTNQSDGVVLMDDHIIASTGNAGSNWSILTSSFNLYTPLKAIEFLDNNTVLLGGWGTTGDFIIRKSTDGGVNWPGILPYDYQSSTGYIYDIDFPSVQTGYAAGGGTGKGYIYKSTNSGSNWIKLDSIGSGEIYELNFINNSTGFASGYSGEIFKTNNGGMNWVTFNTGITPRVNSIFFIDQLTGFACGGSSVQKIIKTTNTGLNWFEIRSTTGDSYSNLHFINSSTGFLSAKGIFKTTDGGTTWSQKLFAPLLYFRKTYFPSVNTGYSFAAYGKLYKTTDSGENWGELSVPTNYFFADIHFLNDNTGFLIGDQGMILKTTNGGGSFVIGIEPGSNSTPLKFELFQNFPNPFNPGTVISYALPKASFVTLKIYDVSGREVSTLISEDKSAGYYDVTFNAANLSSGVYFYKLTAGNFAQSKKLILVK